ncbi:hypothetical protein Pse7367_3394 [Thalassoporum mexicanum PCC 7367]|uniref:hypothetical protein n=1 Tax=Thalassoporum mexicanum TaxID=3457544 RepID=UPI00029FD33B|nr:hypothetical protein [Pseudanabaena sp. PCC 7367]AFY71631.1 hypothetical protein Pse7367_3394 [Pseudanabaena sp. PCC 7367]
MPCLDLAGKALKLSIWLLATILLLERSPANAKVATPSIDPAITINSANSIPPIRYPGAIAYRTRHSCPPNTQALSDQLTQDLYGYLTRTYTRLGFKTQVQLVGNPELTPLPLAAGSRDGVNQIELTRSPEQIAVETGVEQIFITLTTRQAGKTDTTEQAYWLFMTETSKGWRLAMAYTRIGNAPPHDVSDGAIADAVRTWLRDRCY